MPNILLKLSPELLPCEQFLSPREYLPHDNPMIFIDELLAVQEDSIVTRTYVAPNHNLSLFQDQQGIVKPYFALEVMAQSIGAWSGYQRLKHGADPLKVGMLLSVRNFQTQPTSLTQGCVMTTVMRMLFNDNKCGSFEGKIYLKTPQDFAQTAADTPLNTTIHEQSTGNTNCSVSSYASAITVTTVNPTVLTTSTALTTSAATLSTNNEELPLALLDALGKEWGTGRLTTIEVEDHEISQLLG